jgi:hypothetical protein
MAPKRKAHKRISEGSSFCVHYRGWPSWNTVAQIVLAIVHHYWN